MQPPIFDTQAFFLAGSKVLCPSGSEFARDLERFAQRAEAADMAQGGIMVLEALVIFGQAGRNIDEALWNAFISEVAACVRKGQDEAAARSLLPQDVLVIVDMLTPSAASARIVKDDPAIDSEAVASSRSAAIVAALFRALSRHFADAPTEDESAHAAKAQTGAEN